MTKVTPIKMDVIELAKKLNSSSEVWTHFRLKVDDKKRIIPKEVSRPICRHCQKTVLSKRSNTTNLFVHLQNHHPKVYATLEHAKKSKVVNQQTIDEAIDRTKMYESKSLRVKQVNEAVVCFLAMDMQPFYTVEKSGFKQMVKSLDLKYSLPSRKYFSDTEIPRLYTETKERVVIPAVQSADYFSVTTDLWTKHSYLSFTLHFINTNWELKCFALTLFPFLKITLDRIYQKLFKRFLVTGSSRVISLSAQPLITVLILLQRLSPFIGYESVALAIIWISPSIKL